MGFGVYLDICLKTYLNITMFCIKNNDYGYTLAMGYLAPENVFEHGPHGSLKSLKVLKI